jgi:hypothetical protein
MRMVLVITALACALLGSAALADPAAPAVLDTVATPQMPASPVAPAAPDTLAIPEMPASGVAQATKPAKEDDRSAKVPRRIPMVSMALSAVFPGGGQLYTQKYFRAALFGGAIGYCGYRWYDADRQATKFYNLSNQAATLADSIYYFNAYVDQVDNNRRSWMLWTLTVWMISLADAYVDAHMFKFDERALEPKIGLRATPNSLALSASF